MLINSRSMKYVLLLVCLLIVGGTVIWIRHLNLAVVINQKQIDTIHVSSDFYKWQGLDVQPPSWCIPASDQEGCEVRETVMPDIISALQAPSHSQYNRVIPVPITDHRPYIIHVRFTDHDVLVLASYESSAPGVFYGNLVGDGPWRKAPGSRFFRLFRYENPVLQAILNRLDT